MQVVSPLGGFCMNVSTEVWLKIPIHDLNLAVGLWMVGDAHAKGGAIESEEFLPKLT